MEKLILKYRPIKISHLCTYFKGEIKVLGTHFNLEAYSNADVFKTSLFEGKVRVRVKGNNIYLKPDQWYVIIKMEKFIWKPSTIMTSTDGVRD